MGFISINHNSSAASTANALTSHYRSLATSTQRLSTGLRINGAADDAAGLAIRELMRADVTALQQGMRNVNDAISMIQTFDGALGVIDEKLIRMKELAEQAATGTYDSTQRLMIDSEFQAMGAEINRIARATDFNGIKLIDGEFDTPPITVIGNDGKTYNVSITGNETIANNLAPIKLNINELQEKIETSPKDWVGKTTITLTNDNIGKIGDNYLAITVGYNNIPPNTTLNISYTPGPQPTQGGGWSINGVNATYGTDEFFMWSNNGLQISAMPVDQNGNLVHLTSPANSAWTFSADPNFSAIGATIEDQQIVNDELILQLDIDGKKISASYSDVTAGQQDPSIAAFIKSTITIDVQEKANPQEEADPDNPLSPAYKIPDNVVRIHFGSGADKKEDFYDIRKYDATLTGLGLDNVDIRTQDNAQAALVTINDAIVAKDKIRADYGAMQNRFENTFTNLSVQAENLRSAEARLSDAEIATEMTLFVRNQILTQASIAMLAQANMMPQMVARLIGA